MRFSQAVLLAGLGTLGLGTAAAAQVVSTPAVTVNPIAGGNGGGVLLYPGGQYMRVVHPLLQPGEKARDLGAIQLHMPSKRRPSTATTGTTIARAEDAAPVESAPRRAPKPKRTPAPTPAPAAPRSTATASADNGYMPGLGSSAGAASLGSFATGNPPPPTPAPTKIAAAPKPAPRDAVAPRPAAAPPPTKLARAEPPKSAQPEPAEPEAVAPGLNKRSVILFAPEATDPAESALGAIKYLASDLAAAMTGPSSRIQLQAFGGPRGDKSSEARRLSLKRALAIRQVLIDDGVPADRIDVHAGGGVDDSGPADRVDVYIKA